MTAKISKYSRFVLSMGGPNLVKIGWWAHTFFREKPFSPLPPVIAPVEVVPISKVDLDAETRTTESVHVGNAYSLTSHDNLDLLETFSKSKLVDSSLIFLDNRLMLICLLTWQWLVTVSVHNTQIIQLIWRDQHLWGKKCKVNGVHETISHFACNFAKYSPILKILSPADWIINV